MTDYVLNWYLVRCNWDPRRFVHFPMIVYFLYCSFKFSFRLIFNPPCYYFIHSITSLSLFPFSYPTVCWPIRRACSSNTLLRFRKPWRYLPQWWHKLRAATAIPCRCCWASCALEHSFPICFHCTTSLQLCGVIAYGVCLDGLYWPSVRLTWCRFFFFMLLSIFVIPSDNGSLYKEVQNYCRFHRRVEHYSS